MKTGREKKLQKGTMKRETKTKIFNPVNDTFKISKKIKSLCYWNFKPRISIKEPNSYYYLIIITTVTIDTGNQCKYYCLAIMVTPI